MESSSVTATSMHAFTTHLLTSSMLLWLFFNSTIMVSVYRSYSGIHYIHGIYVVKKSFVGLTVAL